MSKILKMIRNEKVEWKKLGDVKEVKTVSAKKKYKKQEYLDRGLYPIIDQGQDFIAGYTNDGNFLFDKNSYVVFGDHTETIKYVDFPFAQGADGIKVIKTCEEYINSKYLYHVLLNFYKTTGDYKRHFSILKELEIPIPSLETQERIVKILDTMVDHFTQLQAELQAELQARNKQYEYYRDKLLSEEYLNKLTEKFGGEVGYDEIKSLCKRNRGIKITAKQMNDLNNSDGDVKIFAAGNTVANVSVEDVGKENIIDEPSVIVKSRGNIDFAYYDKNFSHKNEMWSYSNMDKNILNIKYVYYYLKNNVEYFKDQAVSGKLPQISTGVTDNYIIPVPNIEVQNEIVEFLDRFEMIIKDVDGLLPKEIELRQKQYEYYRERLLDFKREED